MEQDNTARNIMTRIGLARVVASVPLMAGLAGSRR
jgi:hypothetical protein